MQDPPSAIELIELVTEFLRTVAAAQLTGQSAFHARVAANALEIVKRELQQSHRSNREEHTRLRELLGGDGSIEELNAQLARRLANREITLAMTGVAEHLWATTLAKLAIDQPTYATYRRELMHSAGGPQVSSEPLQRAD